jgi:hypothetical protein
MVLIGAAVLIASMARLSSQGTTLVRADDARTRRRPTENEIRYGL